MPPRMFIYPLLSVVFLYLTFPNYFYWHGLWPLGWIALVPIFPLLEKIDFRSKWVAGGLFGVLFYGLLVAWFIPYSLWGYILFVLMLSLQPVLFFGFYGFKPKRHHLDVIFVPALWVGTELLRSLLMKGFSWSLSCSQAFQPLAVQTACLWGPWGITFIMVFVNYCFYKMFWLKSRRTFYAGMIFISLIFIFCFGFYGLRLGPQQNGFGMPLTILAVQPNIDFKKKNDATYFEAHINKQKALTIEGAEGHGLDIVIWPETSIPADLSGDPLATKTLHHLARKLKAYVLVGSVLASQGVHYNSAVLLNPRGDVMDLYHKRHLIPFSEYVPKTFWAQKIHGLLDINSHHFTAGDEAGIFSLTKKGLNGIPHDINIGIGICNEDLLWGIFKDFRRNEADFAVIISNDGWFDRPEGLALHTQTAIMNAVSFRMPVVRVTNTGWTCYIDQRGRIGPGIVLFNIEASARFIVYLNQQ